YRLGRLLKRRLELDESCEVEAQVTNGTLENLERLREKQADFAFIQGSLPETESINFGGLSAIAAVGWQYVHILVPNESDIKSFRDLAGKRVSQGPAKSGNAALGGLVFDYFPSSASIQPVYTNISDIDKDFAAGKMDAVFTVYDLRAPVLERLMNTGKYRLVPVHEAEAVAYSIPGCFATHIPHSVYGPDRNIPARSATPFSTLKVKTLLVTRTDMYGYVVQDLLQTIYSTQFIKESGLPELNEKNGREIFDLLLHPAADRYYRRNDPVTADKYEIGSALLAGLLFIASIVGFVMNRYKIKVLTERKKNIVPYFEEMLQFSSEMVNADSIEQLKNLLDRMMAMQRRAEKEWLDGKLDTEHVENLYAIYGIRCENVFNRMQLLQLAEGQAEKSKSRKGKPSDTGRRRPNKNTPHPPVQRSSPDRKNGKSGVKKSTDNKINKFNKKKDA
ncbi:MAG: ABC transporter substrate-binding protein, partial [bacterium]|nr:ABC transporter substrate-binding protein [bacterium]